MNRAELNRLFKNVLEETIIPDDASVEDKQRALTKIQNLILPNVPKRLFRFRSPNLYSVMSFEHNTITLCNPDLFTDKFDSVVYVDKEKIRKDILTGFTDEFQKKVISEIRATGKMLEPLMQYYGVENSKTLVDIYTHVSDKEIEQAMINNRNNNLNHLLESIPNIAAEQVKIIRENKQTKIACFTENVRSKYMWDRYASGYKGFALEYDFTGPIIEEKVDNPDEKINPILFPVVYSDTMYNATEVASWWLVNSFLTSSGLLSAMPFPDLLYWYKAFLFKEISEYSVEKEWRFMCTCVAKKDDLFLEMRCGKKLKAIYYGPYIETDIKDHLRTWAHSHKIEEYDVLLDRRSDKFDLSVCQLK